MPNENLPNRSKRPRSRRKDQKDIKASQDPKAPKEVKVYGLNACVSLFKSRSRDIIRAYVAEELKGELGYILKWCASQKKAYHIVGQEELEKVSGSTHSEGICLLARQIEQPGLEPLLKRLAFKKGKASLVLLEGVSNPHNLGAIVRVCAHFGVKAIIIDSTSAPTLSGAVYRVAEGGLEHVPVISISGSTLALSLAKRFGYKIISTVVDGGSKLFSTALPERALFLFGSEAVGLSARLRHTSEVNITIPGSGHIESLNVACASAVVLGEFERQHS